MGHPKHAEVRAGYRVERSGRTARIILDGEWTTAQATALDAALQKIDLSGAQEIQIDASGLKKLDSAGA